MPSTSPAARAFDRSQRTVEDARRLVEQDPSAAAEQAVRIAQAYGLEKPGTDPIQDLAKLVTVDRFEPDAGADPVKAAKAKAIFEQNPQLLNLISTEPTDIFSLGYSSNWGKKTPQPFYGRIVMENNQAKFETPTKTYLLALGQQGSTWREEILTAFKDEWMTLSGILTNDGSTLTVETFAPGVHPSPLSGRINPGAASFSVGNVGFNLPPDYQAVLRGTQVSQNDFADWSPAGGVFPGHAEVVSQQWGYTSYNYQGSPDDALYIAGRLFNERIGTVNVPGYGSVDLHFGHTGYYRNTLFISPAGMPIPEASLPLTWGRPSPFPADDWTQGSTEQGSGPRVFFYGIPLVVSNPLVTPEILEIAKTNACLRIMSIGGISHPADIGSFPNSDGSEVGADALAAHLPASVPEMTREEMDFRTSWAGNPPRVTLPSTEP